MCLCMCVGWMDNGVSMYLCMVDHWKLSDFDSSVTVRRL